MELEEVSHSDLRFREVCWHLVKILMVSQRMA